MKPQFFSPEHQKSFEKDGFIVVDDFLSESDTAELLAFYHNRDSGLNKGFHASSHSSSASYRFDVSMKVEQYFNAKASQLFSGYNSLFSAFTVKEPGTESFFDFHLDWSLVNEDEDVSLSIWCPLVDVDSDNGHLWVLRGSHNLGKTFRGGPGLFLLAPNNSVLAKQESYNKVLLGGKAGFAVVYDHRLFHGSPPNLTDTTRVAINHTMIPSGKPSLHYSLDPSKKVIKVYEVDTKFYCSYDMNTPPSEKLNCIDQIQVNGLFLDQEQVNSLENRQPPVNT